MSVRGTPLCPPSPRARGLTMEVWPYISSTSLLGGRRVRLGLGEASTSRRSGELWPERRRAAGGSAGVGGGTMAAGGGGVAAG